MSAELIESTIEDDENGITTSRVIRHLTTWRVWPIYVTWDHLSRRFMFSREELW